MKVTFYSFYIFLFMILILVSSCKKDRQAGEQKGNEKEKQNEKILPPETFAENVITIRADEWMPFNGKPGSDTPGFMVEVLKEIFESQGYVINYRIMPWNRSLKQVKGGHYDGVIGATFFEAPGFVFPEEPLYTMPPDNFYVLDTTGWRYTGIESLESVRIGYMIEYDCGDEKINAYLEKNKGTVHVQIAGGDNPLDDNIKKLFTGRLDTLIASPPVLSWKLKAMNIAPGRIISAGVLGTTTDPNIYAAFSPAKETSKKYADMFDKKMKELRASGRLEELLHKYALEDF